MVLPEKYDALSIERKWQEFWTAKNTYQFNPKSKAKVFSIDTPPPYASADHLHVGHGMHYSQFEFVARYKRMIGMNVFFPMGYDDNGLPTERFVEKKLGVDSKRMDRQKFIQLCLEETKKAGVTYHDLFTSLGFSIDWNLLYQTISPEATRVAQKSFLDLYKKGKMERSDFPNMWCTTCQTSIAQADLDNVDLNSHFSDITFSVDGKNVIIATTRPELIPACVGLFFHPDDDRYKHLKGKKARVPLFGYDVPILADENVTKEKGTGLMMVCTFGDKEDVEKWKKYNLDLRVVFTEDGRMNDLGGKYKGLKVKTARTAILEDLKTGGFLLSQKDISHAVNVHERCKTEIEFLKKPQWQIKILDDKDAILEMGNKVRWFPDHMRVRFEHWVQGLQWNWVISRQRHYGVPFPVWYCKKCNAVLLPDEKFLPVDPRDNVFPGKKCHACSSTDIVPEMDVMDTWMTSSVSPQLNSHWGGKDERKNFLPMSLRPQAHDIIRTWAFYTIAKSFFHHGDIPWSDIMISGHGQDAHGRKMSKSAGNFIVAQDIIKKYSADAFRYWASSVKLGEDLPFLEKEVVTGNKTVIKLFNACKFTMPNIEGYSGGKPKKLHVVDSWLLSQLQNVVDVCTKQWDVYEYSKAKSEVDYFFWHTFCDNYLEIVKYRFYESEKFGAESKLSAQYTLYTAVLTMLKLYAPIMPHITEEIFHWNFSEIEKGESIHTSKWPVINKKLINPTADETGKVLVEIVAVIRKFKSSKQLSIKAGIKTLRIHGEKELLTIVESVKQDILQVCNAETVLFDESANIPCESIKLKVGIELTEEKK